MRRDSETWRVRLAVSVGLDMAHWWRSDVIADGCIFADLPDREQAEGLMAALMVGPQARILEREARRIVMDRLLPLRPDVDMQPAIELVHIMTRRDMETGRWTSSEEIVGREWVDIDIDLRNIDFIGVSQGQMDVLADAGMI